MLASFGHIDNKLSHIFYRSVIV